MLLGWNSIILVLYYSVTPHSVYTDVG